MDKLLDEKQVRALAAQEAVDRLGLLKSSAVGTIKDLLARSEGEHPRVACANLRKLGVQVSSDTKKSLGIRTNAFMSEAALGEINPKGLADPIRAHETTLLRASFVIFRYRNATFADELRATHPEYPIEVQYEVFHPDACETCCSLHKMPVPSDWGLFAPSSCTCDTAPYGLHLEIDYLAAYRRPSGQALIGKKARALRWLAASFR